MKSFVCSLVFVLVVTGLIVYIGVETVSQVHTLLEQKGGHK